MLRPRAHCQQRVKKRRIRANPRFQGPRMPDHYRFPEQRKFLEPAIARLQDPSRRSLLIDHRSRWKSKQAPDQPLPEFVSPSLEFVHLQSLHSADLVLEFVLEFAQLSGVEPTAL